MAPLIVDVYLGQLKRARPSISKGPPNFASMILFKLDRCFRVRHEFFITACDGAQSRDDIFNYCSSSREPLSPPVFPWGVSLNKRLLSNKRALPACHTTLRNCQATFIVKVCSVKLVLDTSRRFLVYLHFALSCRHTFYYIRS